MQLTQHEASFLATCLRYLAVEAPCRARIERIADAVEPGPGATDHLPETIYARAVSMSAVLWAIDQGLVQPVQQATAQQVLEQVWAEGPVRPELIASQLHCLAGQAPADAHCMWTCPAMVHANAGFGGAVSQLRPVVRGHSGLWATVIAEGADTLTIARLDRGAGLPPPPKVPAYGTPVVCADCGRDGTILGVDPDDGWTVVEHHPAVRQRSDGMWEVSPESDGPRQCRYLQDLRALAAP